MIAFRNLDAVHKRTDYESHLHQLLADGDGDGFGAVGCAELGEDGLELLLDRYVRDAELTGDVMIGFNGPEAALTRPVMTKGVRGISLQAN